MNMNQGLRGGGVQRSISRSSPKWLCTKRKVQIKDGRVRSVYVNSRTGEERVRRKTTSRDGKVTRFVFAKFSLA